MEVLVRELVEADREALRRLYVAARDAAFVWARPGVHRLEDFDRNTEGERVLVADCSGFPVGFAAIWEPDSFLHSLFVHPDFQRRGVGGALLVACDPYFSRAPTLKCIKANKSAQRFYVSRGWRVIGEGPGLDGPHLVMIREPSLSSGQPARNAG